jgi:uncharacterized membrane protein
MTEPTTRSPQAARNTWSGVFFGVGLAAFVDEAVFHQLLHWHHFYDKATTEVGLVSDGLLHALSWFATVAALFMFADLRRRRAFSRHRWLGGLLVGAGGFQLYDGLMHHKVMGLHQIRYVPNVLPYDVVWNVVAVVILFIGVEMLVRRRSAPEPDINEGHSPDA